jgi:hypothetical protein
MKAIYDVIYDFKSKMKIAFLTQNIHVLTGTSGGIGTIKNLAIGLLPVVKYVLVYGQNQDTVFMDESGDSTHRIKIKGLSWFYSKKIERMINEL